MNIYYISLAHENRSKLRYKYISYYININTIDHIINKYILNIIL